MRKKFEVKIFLSQLAVDKKILMPCTVNIYPLSIIKPPNVHINLCRYTCYSDFDSPFTALIGIGLRSRDIV